MAPKGTSPKTVALLNAKFRQAFEKPETIDTLEKIGIIARSETTDTFAMFIQSEQKNWQAIIADVGLKPQ